MKPSLLLILGILLLSSENGIAAETSNDKSVTINIPSGLPPPASAEEVLPKHPFFADSAVYEAMEKVQELEERIEKLEKAVSQLEKGKN